MKKRHLKTLGLIAGILCAVILAQLTTVSLIAGSFFVLRTLNLSLTSLEIGFLESDLRSVVASARPALRISTDK